MKFYNWFKKLARAIRAGWTAALDVFRSEQPEDCAARETAAKEATETAGTGIEVVDKTVGLCQSFNAAMRLATFLTDNPIVTSLLVQAMGCFAPFLLKVALVAGIGWLLRKFHVLEWLKGTFDDLKETLANAGELLEWIRRCWEWFAGSTGAPA